MFCSCKMKNVSHNIRKSTLGHVHSEDSDQPAHLPMMQSFFMRTMKTLIRLLGRASEGMFSHTAAFVAHRKDTEFSLFSHHENMPI